MIDSFDFSGLTYLGKKSGVVLLISVLTILFIYFVPIIEPEYTIQCVSAPCKVPNLTIWEWIVSKTPSLQEINTQ